MATLVKDILINIKETSINSLKFCFDAYHNIEKIFWLLIGLTGFVFMCIIVYYQTKLWYLYPIMSSRKWINISEVDFPAITFCHQGNTRLESLLKDSLKLQGTMVQKFEVFEISF